MQLKVTNYESTTRWRWELADDLGNHLDDHEVSLDTAAAEYHGYLDPPAYVRALRIAQGPTSRPPYFYRALGRVPVLHRCRRRVEQYNLAHAR